MQIHVLYVYYLKLSQFWSAVFYLYNILLTLWANI